MSLRRMLLAVSNAASSTKDAFFNYVTLLLNGDGTNGAQNNNFRDSSPNNFTLTRAGTPTQGTFSPFSQTGWSANFNGTTEYLVAPSGAAFQYAGDFCVEGWAYPSSFATDQPLVDCCPIGGSGTRANGFLISINTLGNIRIFNNGGGLVATTNTLNLNQWNHWVFIRTGTTLSGFVNGVRGFSITNSTNFSQGGCVIGHYGDVSFGFLASPVSNLRIVNGVNPPGYSATNDTLTVPTAPLSAIGGTSLLTLQSNRFVDNSLNRSTITVVGTPSVQAFSPFNPSIPNSTAVVGGSAYFNGTSDYLTAPYNTTLQFPGDFTIECFVYINSKKSTSPCVIGNYSTFTTNGALGLFASHTAGTANKYNVAFNGTFPAINSTSDIRYNAWQHLALVRSGSTITLYVDGIANGTHTSSATVTGTANSWWIGTAGDTPTICFLNGYVSNLRATKGTAVYTANFTPPTAPLTAISGTSLLTLQSSSFIDNSANNFPITTVGTPSVQSASPFVYPTPAPVNSPATYSAAPYGPSGQFNGTSSYLTVPNNALWTFGASDVTIEAWVSNTSTTEYSAIVTREPTSWSAGGWSLITNTAGSPIGTLTMWAFDSGSSVPLVSSTGVNVCDGKLHHVAYTRSGSTHRLFVDGILRGTTTNSYTMTNNSGGLRIGNSEFYNTRFIKGYISNLRIVNGTAVYTANFTPPTSPLSAISGTALLTLQSNTFVDNSPNNFAVTPVGSPTIQQFGPFTPVKDYAGSATYSGGSGLFPVAGDRLIVTTPVAAFGTGPFTIDVWIYPTVLVNYMTTATTRPDNGSYSDAWHIGNDSGGGWSLYCGSEARPGAPEGSIKANQWNWLTIVRDSSNLTSIYTNGVRGGSVSNTYNFTRSVMGIANQPNSPAEQMFGYISNLRLTKGIALYDPNLAALPVPTAPTYGGDIQVNFTNAGIADSTAKNNLITLGSAQVSTAVKKYGTGSIYISSGGPYVLGSPPSQNYVMGTGNFTIEGWVRFTTLADESADKGVFQISATATGYQAASTNTLAISTDNTDGTWVIVAGNALNSVAAPSIDTWYHFALVRNTGVTKFYVNGVQGLSITDTVNYTGNYLAVGIARLASASLVGYIDDFRITKGVARYTANFTPPAQAFPVQ